MRACTTLLVASVAIAGGARAQEVRGTAISARLAFRPTLDTPIVLEEGRVLLHTLVLL